MEFLVEFEMNVLDGTAQSEVSEREQAEASAAAKLTADGHLLRVWRRPVPTGSATVLGLYRADSEAHLDDLLRALPLYPWMNIAVTALGPHPNDPAAQRRVAPYREPANTNPLPEPRLTFAYRLEATRGSRSIWAQPLKAIGASCRKRAGHSPVRSSPESCSRV